MWPLSINFTKENKNHRNKNLRCHCFNKMCKVKYSFENETAFLFLFRYEFEWIFVAGTRKFELETWFGSNFIWESLVGAGALIVNQHQLTWSFVVFTIQ